MYSISITSDDNSPYYTRPAGLSACSRWRCCQDSRWGPGEVRESFPRAQIPGITRPGYPHNDYIGPCRHRSPPALSFKTERLQFPKCFARQALLQRRWLADSYLPRCFAQLVFDRYRHSVRNYRIYVRMYRIWEIRICTLRSADGVRSSLVEYSLFSGPSYTETAQTYPGVQTSGYWLLYLLYIQPAGYDSSIPPSYFTGQIQILVICPSCISIRFTILSFTHYRKHYLNIETIRSRLNQIMMVYIHRISMLCIAMFCD